MTAAPDPAAVATWEMLMLVPSMARTFAWLGMPVADTFCPTSMPVADATVIVEPPRTQVPVVDAELAVSLSPIVPRYLSSKVSSAAARAAAELAAAV